MNKPLRIGVFVSFVVIIGLFLFSFSQKPSMTEPFAKTNPCPYKNINPLRCEPELAKKKKEYVVLRNEILNYIEQEKQNGRLTSAAVYFRDLQNGPILSINSQENFIPASLLKLPLLITYLKKAEDNPHILQRKATITKDIVSLEQNIAPEKSAQLGKTYTIQELLEMLITYSDNTSWKMLLTDLRKYHSEEDFIETLSDLGIVDPRKRADQQYVTVQSYAAIYRILYNSSYLNLDMSDKALDLLKKSQFTDGIVAGLPSDIPVAHKFGEQKNGNEQQLHDCGIIYYPQNPYILCVMTRGNTIEKLTQIIKEISRNVYEEITIRNEVETEK